MQRSPYSYSADRYRDNRPFIKFNCPSGVLGLLIGRGGSNIQELQRRTNTTIHINRNNSFEVPITIFGDPHNFVKIKKMILTLASKPFPGNIDPQFEDIFFSNYNPSNRPPKQETPQPSTGSITDQSSWDEDLWDTSPSATASSISLATSNKLEEEAHYGEASTSGTYTATNGNDYNGSSEPGTSFRHGKNNGVDYTDQAHTSNFQRFDYNQVAENNTSHHVPQDLGPPRTNDEPIDFDKLNELYDKAQEELWASFPPVKKNFYNELPEIRDLTEEEVAVFRKNQNNIVVERLLSKPSDNVAKAPVQKPIRLFNQAFHEHGEIMDIIKGTSFTAPTPIQCQGWPIILSGEDFIGISQTGSGKTLVFLFPAFIHIVNQDIPIEKRGPSVLIMAPTRELAIQIFKESQKYKYRDVKSVCIYGGVSRNDQIAALKQRVDIIVGTPGRIEDLINAGFIDPHLFTYVVLDEGDRMLDMGFGPQIRKILFKLRPSRQTIMTSATWPAGVRLLAQRYMNDPIQVYIGCLDLTAVHSVTQRIEILPSDEDVKFEHLLKFARNLKKDDRVIVFVGMKAKADNITSELALKRINVASIHSNMEQYDREQAIVDISDGTASILIATDVASRGIDIENLTYVINYDFPRNIEEYVHRIGRTGRAGRRGEAITYFSRRDSRHAKGLIKILEEANQEVPEKLKEFARTFRPGPRRY